MTSTFDLHSLERSDKLRSMFEVIEGYRKRQMRAAMFNEMLQLEELCVNDAMSSLQLSDLYIEIGEVSFASRLLRSFSVSDEHKLAVALCQARCDAVLDRRSAENQARKLLSEVGGDVNFWLRLSELAEYLLGVKPALNAAKRALALSSTSDDTANARYRLAFLYKVDKSSRAALRELYILLSMHISSTPRAQQFAELALACGDNNLAVNFVDRWIAAEPFSAHLALVQCHYLIKASNPKRAGAAIDTLISNIRGGLPLGPKQYIDLIEMARKVGHERERNAIDLAVLAYPDDQDISTLRARIAFTARFSLAPSDKTSGSKRPMPNWLRNLLRI